MDTRYIVEGYDSFGNPATCSAFNLSGVRRIIRGAKVIRPKVYRLKDDCFVELTLKDVFVSFDESKWKGKKKNEN